MMDLFALLSLIGLCCVTPAISQNIMKDKNSSRVLKFLKIIDFERDTYILSTRCISEFLLVESVTLNSDSFLFFVNTKHRSARFQLSSKTT